MQKVVGSSPIIRFSSSSPRSWQVESNASRDYCQRKVQAPRILGVSALVALVAAGAAVGATAKKGKLTVAVSGGGTVTSRPAGINCAPKCTLRARRGAKITLTASADAGAEFTHWSSPCATASTCTVKMTAARTVHAYFKAVPPPPPPPPPAPKAGHYVGTYTDGTYFYFDLSGTGITNVNFDFNGECSDGGTMNDSGIYLDGPFTVASDGSFSGTSSITFDNGTASIAVGGNVTTTGTANGTLKVTYDFTNGPECTSTGTWTTQLGS